MSDPSTFRAFVIRGRDVDDAVSWLHVHGEVAGVVEEGASQVVWMACAMPALPATFQVAVEEREVRAADLHVTGLEHDAAIRIVEGLLVRPPWVARPSGFTGIELLVPRGGAFGSGEHDSTKAALSLIHQVWSQPESFADCGTGSGILALYAQVRGCGRIEACDIDEPSVVAARELLPGARVHLGGAATMAPSEMVVANMTGQELAESLPQILGVWTRAQPLVLSGMRAAEIDGLVAAVPARPGPRETLGDFTAVAFTA